MALLKKKKRHLFFFFLWPYLVQGIMKNLVKTSYLLFIAQLDQASLRSTTARHTTSMSLYDMATSSPTGRGFRGFTRSASCPCRMDSLPLGPLPLTAPRANSSPASQDRGPCEGLPVRPALAASTAQSSAQQHAVKRSPHAVESELDLPPTPLYLHNGGRAIAPNAPLMRRSTLFGSVADARALHHIRSRSRSRARCASRSRPAWKDLQVEKPPTTPDTDMLLLDAPILFVFAGANRAPRKSPRLSPRSVLSR